MIYRYIIQKDMEEKLFFKNAEGLTLCGILSLPEKQATKCIILCHGITVDKDEGGVFVALTNALADRGFAVFRFDFRAHGESEGNSIDLTVTGKLHDLETAVKLLEEKGFKTFGLLGASFGGGIASLYTSRHAGKIKALVLWNALLDYLQWLKPTTEWGKKYFGKPAMERIEKQGYTEIGSIKYKIGQALMDDMENLSPMEELMKVEIPILFVHGSNDTYIDVEDSGFHDRAQDAEKATETTVQFFKAHL
ncbi:MAG: alpha/beta fold hydrolase [Candidatus Levybacteria bacterium]|nr:alpha/beta fold hydrolase [Candidatus Levybacteria bacterium]